MRKRTALFIAILGSFCNQVYSQDAFTNALLRDTKRDTKTINLLALDSKNESVKIIPDYANHVLKFISKRDSIIIDDFWGVPPTIKRLNKNFISVEYAVRGGSGVGLGNVVILCIKSHKLCQSLFARSYMNGEGGGEEDKYSVKLKLTGNSITNYNLSAKIHDEVKSSSQPEISYKYNNVSVLSFDKTSGLFYSVKHYLNNCVIKDMNNKVVRSKVSGTFLEAILGNATYYFVNNNWYELIEGRDLYKFK